MTTELTGNWGAQFAACLRLMLVSAVILCVLYPLVILAVGRTFTPWTAAGSLLLNERGQVVGSAQIARLSPWPEYFWPRPSAVDYAANATGGSNLSPAGRRPAGTRVGKPEKPGGHAATQGSGGTWSRPRAAAWIRTLP